MFPRSLALLCALAMACVEPVGTPPCSDCGVDAGAEAPWRPAAKIASFNVKLFFDTVCDSGACAAGDFEKAPTQAEFDARAEQIAQGITRLGADVVALQEIENQAALDALVARLPDHPHAVLGELGFPASVDVAVVSRYPILEVVRHRDRDLFRPDGSYTRFSREFLEVHVEVAGARVVVFAAHFRSKSNDDPGRRWAEAVAAHDIAVEASQRLAPALVVIAGDLNDVPGSEPMEALESDGKLWRTSKDQPQDQIGTYVYFGESQPIDHLLIAQGAGAETVSQSFTVMRDGRGYAGSDHAAIHATFLLPQ